MTAKSARPAKPRTVKVAFTLPAEVEASDIALCGEFNNWSTDGIKLSRDGEGTWRATVSLEPGRAYRYRYLLDGQRWENGWDADSYLPNPYGEDDSVVIVAG
jgi:1,4-alpha-glucan branching enzyme